MENQQAEKLTEEHKRKRIEYCRKMKGHNWNTVMFSKDFVWVQGLGSLATSRRWMCSRIYSARSKTSRLDLKENRTLLFEENLNSDVYLRILKSRLKESHITYAVHVRDDLNGDFYKMDIERIHQKIEHMWISICLSL